MKNSFASLPSVALFSMAALFASSSAFADAVAEFIPSRGEALISLSGSTDLNSTSDLDAYKLYNAIQTAPENGLDGALIKQIKNTDGTFTLDCRITGTAIGTDQLATCVFFLKTSPNGFYDVEHSIVQYEISSALEVESLKVLFPAGGFKFQSRDHVMTFTVGDDKIALDYNEANRCNLGICNTPR